MKHLNTKTLDELKQLLHKQKERLEEDLSSFANKRDDLPDDWETRYEDIGYDKDENAFEVEDYSNKRAVEHELEAWLKKVNQALERIKNGKYGICKEDGKPISVERLQVNPSTQYCQKHAK